MPRPPKPRWVEFLPDTTYFKPAGIPVRNLEEITLTITELESLRLKDINQLTQEEAAECMQVSRPTFQRILTLARQKVATALTEGKAIRIEGGDYRLSLKKYTCNECGNEFEIPRAGRGTCPSCRHRHRGS